MRNPNPLSLYVIVIASGLAACSSSSNDSASSESASHAPPQTAQAASGSLAIEYGRHYPNGEAAVQYLMGPEGTWKQVTAVEYVWNYYSKCASPGKPFDKRTLIQSANGQAYYTAPDADCNLLFDVNGDGDIDAQSLGYAFHEHNGKGVGGAQKGAAFTNFWYDDNRLARLVMQAYGQQLPAGFAAVDRFSRWQILSGNTYGWTPSGQDHFDHLARDGLYFAAVGNLERAMERWRRLRDLSGARWSTALSAYEYPNIVENYHLGLFLILTAALGETVPDPALRDELLQHKVALRANILRNQEYEDGLPIGWRTHVIDQRSLINTETVSVDVLGLGAEALEVFEAGQSPLQKDDGNYELRSHALSATAGSSLPGYMISGPGRSYPPGTYQGEFVLRATGPLSTVARLEVTNATTGQLLRGVELDESNVRNDGHWFAVSLSFTVTQDTDLHDFQLYWYGATSLEVAYVRIH